MRTVPMPTLQNLESKAGFKLERGNPNEAFSFEVPTNQTILFPSKVGASKEMPRPIRCLIDHQLPPDEKLFLRKRYYVTVLVFLAMGLNFLLRINPAEYNWTSPEKGLILSSFSWGFLFTPFGHLLASRMGGATVLAYTVLFTGILTILSPMLISAGIYVFMVARGFEGLFEGMTISSFYTIFAAWIPSNERSLTVNIVFLGIPAGITASYYISGVVSSLFGWKFVFYITGGLAVVWFVLWTLTVADTPELDTYITKKEKNYITQHNKQFFQPTKDAVLPLKSIITSKAILAYLNERFVEAWSASFLSYCLPLFIKDVHSVSIMDIGFFSAIPHFFTIFSSIAGSSLQDYMRRKSSISRTKCHKSFILFGQILAIAVFATVGTWIDFYGNLIAFCVFKIGFGVAEISYRVLPLDLCPQHSNFLGSLSMCALAIGYLINPVAMGFMVQNHTTAEWSRYFWFLACFNLWGAIIFAKFGSGELQQWPRKD